MLRNRYVIWGIFITILLSSCKKDPKPFQYVKTIGYGFTTTVQMMIWQNEIYFYDYYTSKTAFGKLNASSGEKTILCYLDTKETDYAFDGAHLYYITNDSLISYTIQNGDTAFISRLGYSTSSITGTNPHVIFADASYVYYVRYHLVSGFITYTLCKWDPLTKAETTITDVVNSAMILHDNQSIFYMKVNPYPYATYSIVKIDKSSNAQTSVSNSTQAIVNLIGIDNNTLYYTETSDSMIMHSVLPAADAVCSDHGRTSLMINNNFFENGWYYYMSSETISRGCMVSKFNISSLEKINFASSLHGIQRIVLTDDHYLYVLDQSGAIGLLNL